MTVEESVDSEERNRLTLQQARLVGLIGETKDARIAGRVSSRLVEAAKRRAGVSSDTELLEIALSKLALEDDFGPKLVARKGTVSPDIDLGI
jgi:hypothetical protein